MCGTNVGWQKRSIRKDGVTTLVTGTLASSQTGTARHVIVKCIIKISNCLLYCRPPMFQSELYLIVGLLQKRILKGSPCQRNLHCRLGHTE